VFDIPDQKILDFDKLKWGKIISLIKVERSGTRGKKDYDTKSGYHTPVIRTKKTLACVIFKNLT
jgi:hypothetical protein